MDVSTAHREHIQLDQRGRPDLLHAERGVASGGHACHQTRGIIIGRAGLGCDYLAHACGACGECNVFTVSVLPSVHKGQGALGMSTFWLISPGMSMFWLRIPPPPLA